MPIKGTTSLVVQILDKQEFINYYKKSRIKFKSLISEIRCIEDSESLHPKLLTSDVDIYMMAMNDLDCQEGYYYNQFKKILKTIYLIKLK